MPWARRLKRRAADMTKPTALELFAAYTAQLPLLTREDLEATVDDLRQSPAWARALRHARLQAKAIGLEEPSFDPMESGERLIASA
jgi:hypothetical protein